MAQSADSRNIVDVGKFLQQYGLKVGENPAFGGVSAGAHSPTGYHPQGLAIDVTDWRPDMAPAYKGGPDKPWKQRTGELSWRAKQLGVFDEVLGPGDKGHDTHVHLALKENKPLTSQQLQWLATGRYQTNNGLTDVMPGAAQPETPTSAATGNVYNFYFGGKKSGDSSNPLLSSLVSPLDYLQQFTQQKFNPLSMVQTALNPKVDYSSEKFNLLGAYDQLG